MKNNYFAMLCVLVFVLVACSGNGTTATIPTPGQHKATVVPTATQTFTPEPETSDTPLPTATMTATASITPTPTVTPENFTLADSGFDIAKVRVFNSGNDLVHIDFEYRIDPSKKLDSEVIVIGALLPTTCMGVGDLGPTGTYGGPDLMTVGSMETQDITGDGELVIRQITAGRCEISSFGLLILFMQKIGTNNFKFREVYRERINQPLKVFKTEPAPKFSKLVTLKNFSFEATGAWAGNLTFDYVVLPEYFDSVRGQKFRLGGAGDILYCQLDAEGPSITEAAGTYTISIDMNKYHPNNNWAVRCHDKLAENSRLVINQISLSLFKNDDHYVEFGIVLRKQP